MFQTLLKFLPLNIIFNDTAEPWGSFFQGDPKMEGLEELHNNIMFYLAIILFAVSWIMLSMIIQYRAKLFDLYANNVIFAALVWIITHLLVLIVFFIFIYAPSIYNDSPGRGQFFQDNTLRLALEQQTTVCLNWEQPFSNASRTLYATYYDYNDILTTVSNRQWSGNFIAAHEALKEQHCIRIIRLLEPANTEDPLTYIKWNHDMIKTRWFYTRELKTLLIQANASFTEQEQRDLNEIKDQCSQAWRNYVNVKDGYKRDLLTQRSLRQVLSN